ncbi:MAG: tripartite tricarboxylate transporter substrate binding protein, partial [Burkholderiales bacterium]
MTLQRFQAPRRAATRAAFAASLTLACATAASLWANRADAQAQYPTHTITLLVGSAPGGSNDVFARTIAKGLQEAWG